MTGTLSSPAARALSDFLLALAGVAQQLRMPSDAPPMLGSVLSSLDRALATTLREREELIVTVGNVQLLVEGMETNPDFEPLRHLALQLRDAGVGTLVLRPGLTGAALLEVLRQLHQGHGTEALPTAPHLTLRPLRSSGPQAPEPWRALERLVLNEPERVRATHEVHEIAVGLELHPATVAFDTRVLELLAQAATLGERLAVASLERLLLLLPAQTLRRLLGSRGNPNAQREFLRSAAPFLTAASMLRLCQALAADRPELISPAALRVLARMASDLTQGGRATEALEDTVLRLTALAFPEGPDAVPRMIPEPDRVLKLALESGIAESGTQLAADRMIARRQVAGLLALLDTVPRGDSVAAALRQRLFHPQSVRSLLGAQPVDLDSLDRLIPQAGLDAAPVLLDALADSRERRVRLRLLDLLARFGDPVGPLALERMDGMPWYVQRNLLALLARLPDVPVDCPIPQLLDHRDLRVRHEAIVLALADPEHREAAMQQAMVSSHEPTLRLGLTALSDSCPVDLLPRLMSIVMHPTHPEEVRALAVSAIAATREPSTLRMLRRLVVGRGIANLGRLAPRSPMMLAALRGLSTHWGQHPKVASLLEAARQSREPEIREAARLGVVRRETVQLRVMS